VHARVGGAKASKKDALAKLAGLFSGVPKESIAIVLSAEHSLEDNWAMRELGTVLMGTKAVYRGGRADGYEDAILIHRDKNPNGKGVDVLFAAAKPLQALVDDVKTSRVTHVIALGSASPVDVEGLRGAKVVTIAAHEGPVADVAAVVLPATSWAEQSGTFVNAKSIRQVSEQAIEPQGESQPAWSLVADVAKALGYEAAWTKKQIRTRLSPAQAGGVTDAPVSGATSPIPAE
jgi:NADH-quinone oxidoreductase subunit G